MFKSIIEHLQAHTEIVSVQSTKNTPSVCVRIFGRFIFCFYFKWGPTTSRMCARYKCQQIFQGQSSKPTKRPKCSHKIEKFFLRLQHNSAHIIIMVIVKFTRTSYICIYYFHSFNLDIALCCSHTNILIINCWLAHASSSPLSPLPSRLVSLWPL